MGFYSTSHQLVESFKSTLDESREADILLRMSGHRILIFEEQIEIVNSTLAKIEDLDKPTIMVFNKFDAFSYEPKREDDLTPRTAANNSTKIGKT